MGVSSVRQGRKWPLAYWTELAEILIKKYNCQIVLTGSKEDAEEAKIIENLSSNITSFCSKLSLTESAALMQRCRIVISGDTGPLHIATAVGARTIGLYGAAPISRTGPYGNNTFALKADLKCIPCNRRKCKFQEAVIQYNPCMLNLEPEIVLNIIDDIFKA